MQTAGRREPLVVSYGAGVDSTAMLIEMQRRQIRPDLILFADTGDEKPLTYDYLALFDRWLRERQMPGVITVKRRSPRAGDTSLSGECLRKSMLPSLAYGLHSCSLKWKVEPMEQFVRRWSTAQLAWSFGMQVVKAIGYDAGPRDQQRARKAHARPDNPKYRYWYPLIEWGVDRERCEALISAAGLPVPVKSACFHCPASKPHEVDELAVSNPEMARTAIEMERRAHERGLRTVKGLGRRWSWTERLQGRVPA